MQGLSGYGRTRLLEQTSWSLILPNVAIKNDFQSGNRSAHIQELVGVIPATKFSSPLALSLLSIKWRGGIRQRLLRFGAPFSPNTRSRRTPKGSRVSKGSVDITHVTSSLQMLDGCSKAMALRRALLAWRWNETHLFLWSTSV